jgi:Skp family chaperone for outer membrane proteins
MKSKVTMFVCLLVGVILFFGYQYSSAGTSKPGANIGVVDIEKVLHISKAGVKYKEQLEAEDKAAAASQNQLAKEIQNLTSELKSGAFKKSSIDYMTRYRELLQKQAQLKAEDDFLPQQRASKYQQWAQQIYQRTLQITKELAEKKGLYLVMTSEDVTFPMETYDELMSTMTTHKVLYSGGCVDLTAEVIVKLDAEQTDKPKN